jgi:hypothetical protein
MPERRYSYPVSFAEAIKASGAGALVALLALAFVSAVLASPAYAGPGEAPAPPTNSKASPPDRYIVVLEDSVERPGRVAERHSENRGAQISQVYRHAINGYAAEIPAAQLDAIRHDPNVAYVEPDYRGEIASQTVPTGINRIFATSNETLAIDEVDERVDVDVAVFDTGIAEHDDLNVVGRIDCSGNPCEKGGSDGSGHGTHVAGTIAALDDGFGVVGVAPGARLWAIKVVDDTGAGKLSELIAGIDWVTATREDANPENDIEVTNASLRYWNETFSNAFKEALEKSLTAGVVHVAAAGNESEVVKYLPGSNFNEITVSALADFDGEPSEGEDSLAGFSNFGTVVDVAAPGVNILSTLPNDSYGELSGTSMASPHVAGAAAILAAAKQPQNGSDVKAIRDAIVEEGNFAWEDTSGDAVQEPLLDVSEETVFAAELEAGPPGIIRSATEVTATAATVAARFSPTGSETTYQFEYGKNLSYGSVAPPSPKAVEFGEEGESGPEPTEINERLTELTPETTYHVRMVATNENGTFYSPDREFTTLVPKPTVSNTYAMPIGNTSATLNATINPHGYESKYYFEYEDALDYGTFPYGYDGSKVPIAPKAIGSGTADVQVGEALAGLEPNTIYHYRVVAENAKGTTFGEERLLQTRTVDESPIVTTKSPTNVTKTGSTLTAAVNPHGLSTSYQFEFGKTTAYGLKVPASSKAVGEGVQDIEVNEPIEGLEPDTTYHVRIVASNGAGTSIGKDLEFKTAVAPVATTKAASNVMANSAMLNGTINPKGFATTYQFEYGKTTAYGNKVPVPAKEAGSGTSGVEVSTAISGLEENNRYHFRLVTTSIGGVAYGEDISLDTASLPFAFAKTATELVAGGATLRGLVIPGGAATTYQFEYGESTAFGSKVPVPAKSVGSGTNTIKVSEKTSSLKAGTMYYYRLAATNEAGTRYSGVQSFKAAASGEWVLQTKPIWENQEAPYPGFKEDPFEGEIEAPYEALMRYYDGYNWIDCKFGGKASFQGGSADYKIVSVGAVVSEETGEDEWSYESEEGGGEELPPRCDVQSGKAIGCEGQPTGENLPWSVEPEGSYFKIKGYRLNSHFEEGWCAWPEWTVFGDPTVSWGKFWYDSEYSWAGSGVLTDINGYNRTSGGYYFKIVFPTVKYVP